MEKYCRLLIVQMCVAVVMFAMVSFNVSYCQAAQWEKVAESTEQTVEIDASTVEWVEYPELGRNIVCWYKYIENDKSSNVYHCAFRETNGTPEYAVFGKISFDSTGNQIDHQGTSTPDNSVYRPVVPGSDGEQFFQIAKRYAK